MFKMIVKELGNDKKNGITDVLLYSASIAVLSVSFVLLLCTVHIKESTWFEAAQEVQMKEGDLLVSERADLLVGVLGFVCAVVWVFVIGGMILFVHHSLEKEFYNNSVLEAMGYHCSIIGRLNVLKQVLYIIISIFPSWGIEMLMWNILKKNDVVLAVLEFAKMRVRDLGKALITALGIALIIAVLIVYGAQKIESRKTIKMRLQQQD